MTPGQLVSQWRKIVNNNADMGKDVRLFKQALDDYTAPQILLGMYWAEGTSITVPQFMRRSRLWLEEDEETAEIELAVLLTHTYPPEYFTWKDLKDEEGAWAFNHAFTAKQKLKEWVDRILA